MTVENITVDEQTATRIARMQYERTKSLFARPIAPEAVWINNRAAEILANGCHPDELKHLNSQTGIPT